MGSRAAVIVVGSLAAAAGATSAAEAQVTGTLQASVRVVGDPVRDTLISSVTKALGSATPPPPAFAAGGVAARLYQLPADADRRRIRLEILY